MSDKIKVLIVDDSRLARQVMSTILNSDPEFEIIGMATDPLEAEEMLKILRPTVITLDIEMPNMSGLEFLKKLMATRPIPVVMCSTLTTRGSTDSIECLRLGAVDYIHKSEDLKQISSYAEEIIKKVKNAARANVQSAQVKANILQAKPVSFIRPLASSSLSDKIILIGASTGGVEALSVLLGSLPLGCPPIAVVLHIPKEFCKSFVSRLNMLCKIPVHLAENDMEMLPGNIYLCPGGEHMLINKIRNRTFVLLNSDEPVSGHRPSVDVMFHSILTSYKNNVIAVLLTGMGSDGAKIMKEIRIIGGRTIAQDKNSSVVWGMPGAAVKLDGAEFVLPLNEIPQKIVELL